MADIEVYKGDSMDIQLTIKDSSDVAVNITGYTIYFTVKEAATDTDANAKIAKEITTHTTPASGITTISLSSSNTSLDVSSSTQKYVYDIRMKDTSSKVTTLFNGYFIVKQPVTLSTS